MRDRRRVRGLSLGAIHVECEPHEDSPLDVRVIAPGALVSRFRDEVIALRDRGELEPEIPALLADGERGLLLGVPEIAKEVLARSVGSVRVAKTSYAMPPWFFTVWGECPWRFDVWPGHITDAEKKSALKEGEFGGFLVPEHGTQLIVLALQKFQVAGFYCGKARVAVPRLASRRLQGHPGFQIEWTQLVPDRSRRPL